jgi:isorenieratene synthase
MSTPKRAIVVGSGIAGLSAAAHLAEAGVIVTVLEKQPYLGGRLSTPMQVDLDHQGKTWTFPVEHGIHGYWRQYRNLKALLKKHGLDHRLIDSQSQEIVIWIDGDRPRFVEVGDIVRDSKLPDPFCFLELMRQPEFLKLSLKAGPLQMAQVGWDMAHAFAFDPDRDMDEYEELSVSQLIGAWPPYLKKFFKAMTHSSFFMEVEKTSLGAFLTSLQFYTIKDKRDIGFEYMDGSTEECVLRPLADVVESNGGRVLTGNLVEEVLFEGGRVAGVRAQDARGRSRVLKADACILAVDPPGMGKLREQGELARFTEGMHVPEGVHSHTVRLWFGKSPSADRATNGMAAGPDIDNYFWLSTIQRPYVEWAQATGGSCIEAHQYGKRATWAAQQPDEVVIEAAVKTVEACWPGVRGSLVKAHLKRNPPTHVGFNPGTYALLPKVRTRCENLALCGDWIEARYPVLYLERGASTGLEAARTVAPELGIDVAGMDDILAPFPSSKGFDRYQAVARGFRELGLLPNLGRRSR